MIFVLSKKAFDANHKKYLKKKDYLIIDASAPDAEDLSQEYNRVTPVGNLTPGNKLIRGILAKKRDKYLEISESKLEDMKDNFLSDRDTLVAMMSVTKVLVFENDEPGNEIPIDKNVFVVYPNKTYKALGKDIIKTWKAYFEEVDGKFIYSEEDLEEDKSLLEKKLKKPLVKDIIKRLDKLEKTIGKKKKKGKNKKKKKW